MLPASSCRRAPPPVTLSPAAKAPTAIVAAVPGVQGAASQQATCRRLIFSSELAASCSTGTCHQPGHCSRTSCCSKASAPCCWSSAAQAVADLNAQVASAALTCSAEQHSHKAAKQLADPVGLVNSHSGSPLGLAVAINLQGGCGVATWWTSMGLHSGAWFECVPAVL